MKISIIVPVYNVEQYLAECLESLVSQDMSDYEIICIEDCSEDNSMSILKEYAQKYSNIKIIRHTTNKGLSAARNSGIKAARGEYLQFVDSDDMIVKGACKKLYNNAKKSDADIVYFNMEFLNDTDKFLIRHEESNIDYVGQYTGRQLFCLYEKNNNHKTESVRQFIKREFVINNHLQFHEGIIHEDVLFYFLAAMKANTVIDINTSLYIYRQREDSIMWSQRDKTSGSLKVCIMNMCAYWLNDESFSDDENEIIGKYIKRIYDIYKQYEHYENEINECNMFGNRKEKIIQNIFLDKCDEVIYLSKDIIDKLRHNEKNIIYGAGKMATILYDYLYQNNVKIHNIVVTNKKRNHQTLAGIRVDEINELNENKDAIFIIGTDTKFQSEIEIELRNRGYKNIIKPSICQKRG